MVMIFLEIEKLPKEIHILANVSELKSNLQVHTSNDVTFAANLKRHRHA